MALVITKNCRQQGIGQKLMASLETIARKAGCIKMEVTSAVHRDSAHIFYKKLGYSEQPKRFVKPLGLKRS
jgi:GNAT superfamily N-acetyltransferase